MLFSDTFASKSIAVDYFT